MDVNQNQQSQAQPGPAASPSTPIDAYEQISLRHRSLLRAPHEAKDFSAALTRVAYDLHELIESNLDEALFLTMRRDPSDDGAVHSFSVGLICGAIGRRLGLSLDETLRLIAASLTMNIAMIELQRKLWSQATPLTNEQQEEIRTHPERGRRWLESLGVADGDWLRAVAEHHELPNGSGYPRGLKEVSPLAFVIRNTDTYCAMLGARAYRAPLPANQAARRLYMMADSHKDRVPALIVEEVGIFPPGSFVRLANGELAIATHRGEKANTPMVISLRNGHNESFPKPLVRDTRIAEFSVAELLPPEGVDIQVDARQLYGY